MEFEISLKHLSIYAYHGMYESERKFGNEFIVNLSVFYTPEKQISEINIDSTISYVDLFNIVKEEMSKPRSLLENVALSIAGKINKVYKNINRGVVSIEKVHPPIPEMIGSAVVTLNF